jgi:hydroxyethylthiazole kinase-like uncharacterized protein yjeF
MGAMVAEAPLPAFPPRARDAHKASVGRVLIVGGSVGMAGAPALAARGALRAGAGLVTIAVPRAILATVASFQREAMTAPLPCDDDGAIGTAAIEALARHVERADAVVLGPGLGRAQHTQDFVIAFAQSLGKPLVLDADGLYAVRTQLAVIAKRLAPTVLTPHEREAAALLGVLPGESAAPREEWARRAATDGRAICVLKGPATIVTDGLRVRHNTTGGPILATGGTGDVLAGVVAAFLAGLPSTGGDAFGAAALAVHVHGRAADRLATTRGDRGTLASEVADALPEAIRELVGPAAP